MCSLNLNLLWKMVGLPALRGSKENKSVGAKYQEASLKRVVFSVTSASENIFLVDSRNSSFEDQKQLALLVMETLTVLLQGSNTNAGE